MGNLRVLLEFTISLGQYYLDDSADLVVRLPPITFICRVVDIPIWNKGQWLRQPIICRLLSVLYCMSIKNLTAPLWLSIFLWFLNRPTSGSWSVSTCMPGFTHKSPSNSHSWCEQLFHILSTLNCTSPGAFLGPQDSRKPLLSWTILLLVIVLIDAGWTTDHFLGFVQLSLYFLSPLKRCVFY